jgi:hypothetical protein
MQMDEGFLNEKLLKSIVEGLEAAPEKGLPGVFLSHSLKDKELVDSMAKSLSETGSVKALTAEETPQPGTVLKDRVKELIKQSIIVIAVITEDSKHSEWVNWEIGYSEGIGRTVVPFLEEGVKVTGTLEGIERIRFERHNPVEALKPIEKSIENLVKKRKGPAENTDDGTEEDLNVLGDLIKGAIDGISRYYKG